MLSELGGTTMEAVRLALDVGLLRHQTIAHNIANASAEGYAARRVSFEAHLHSADLANTAGREALAQVGTDVRAGRTVHVTGDAVRLDQEVVELTQNALRYQALIEGMSKRSSLIRLAVSEGR